MLSMLLGAIAPTIASAVKDMAFDKAIDFVKEHTGLDLSSIKSEDDVKNLSPEQMQKIKEADTYLQLKLAEMEHQEAMYDKSLEEQKMVIDADMEDRQQARDIYKQQQQSSSVFTRHFLEIMALIVFISSIGVFAMALFADVKNQSLLSVIVEFFKAVDLIILGFFYGSSHGSKVKTNIIADKKETPSFENALKEGIDDLF